MTAVEARVGRTATLRAGEKPTWGVAHFLAVVGFVFVFWQGWTWVSWLAAGPHSITQFRDTNSASWYGARVFEGVAVVISIAVLTFVVRRCRREHRLTWDAKLIIAGAATMWLDSFTNVLAPLFMYSSNWVNLNTPAGSMPLAVNPDIGRLPWPILYLGLIYTFGLLAFAMVMTWAMRAFRRRWPALSVAKLIGLVFLLGVVVDIAMEIPMYRLRLWAYPGSPDFLALWSKDGMKLPLLVEVLPAGVAFATMGALRYFRDDMGRGVTERGLERHHPLTRSVISILALIAIMNGVWFVATSVQAAVGNFSGRYEKMPAHIVNDMCNAPGITGTRYGPCPGSPGFKAPIRTLPGPKP